MKTHRPMSIPASPSSSSPSRRECPSELDCATSHECPPESRNEPDIDYSRAGFRASAVSVLDRFAQQVPDWRERNAADLGVAIIELMAYAGDQLTYRQDAVATEAYLGTARSRDIASPPRAARRLPDARRLQRAVFVHLELDVGAGSLVLPKEGIQFLTPCDKVPIDMATGSADAREGVGAAPHHFRTRAQRDPVRRSQRAAISHLERRALLPSQGRDTGDVGGAHPDLHVGDWLRVRRSSRSEHGVAEDANPQHRQVVLLTKVWASVDPIPTPADVTEIEWAAANALTFPLCLSAVTDRGTWLEAAHRGQRGARQISCWPIMARPCLRKTLA